MTSKPSCFLLVDSSITSPSSTRRTLLTQQTEGMTERLPGTVPSKHTFVKAFVLLTGIMAQGIRKQILKTHSLSKALSTQFTGN